MGHDFSIKSPSILTEKHGATCQGAAEYYYLCHCGEMGEECFSHGEPTTHKYLNDKCIFCSKAFPYEGGEGLDTPLLPYRGESI